MDFPKNGTHSRGSRDNLPRAPKLDNGLTIHVYAFKDENYSLAVYYGSHLIDSASNQDDTEAKRLWNHFFAQNGKFPNFGKLKKAKKKHFLPHDFAL